MKRTETQILFSKHGGSQETRKKLGVFWIKRANTFILATARKQDGKEKKNYKEKGQNRKGNGNRDTNSSPSQVISLIPPFINDQKRSDVPNLSKTALLTHLNELTKIIAGGNFL